MHGDKKNGANREAKAEQNTVKPKQVKENAVFAAFCVTESGTAAFRLREQKYTGKGGKFCPERR